MESATSTSYSDSKHKELYDFISGLKENDKLGIIAAIIEDEPYGYDEMNEQEMTEFIMENLIMGINCQLYKESTDKGAIDWAFYKILKYRANRISPGAKGWLYYNCLVNAMSYTCKDLKLLDDVDHFITSPHGYIGSDQYRFLANKFNLAFRLRAINEKTNMIELGNKENKGWYGNPDKAIYKFELAAIDNHLIPWIEDTGITEYYIKNREDIDKYAKSHNWSDNKKTHTYKKIKNNYIADEKKKGLNCLRLLEAMNKAGAFTLLMRNDQDYYLYREFWSRKFHGVHPRWDD